MYQKISCAAVSGERQRTGQEKSLKESLRKKGLILGIFIVALWIINEVTGLGNLFVFCPLLIRRAGGKLKIDN